VLLRAKVGARLLRELRRKKLSQKDLAGRMGRPVQAICEIVRGKKRIMAETVIQLERVLGVSAKRWLLLQLEKELT
jgi:addiction module HigA family antidote